jgi:Uma2 family endonuclease
MAFRKRTIGSVKKRKMGTIANFVVAETDSLMKNSHLKGTERMAHGTASTKIWTLADLVAKFGPLPASRIRHDPPPGTATEQDVLDIQTREKRLCELVDGVLVEKTMGFYESRLAMVLGHFLEDFLDKHDLGIVAGEAGLLRLGYGLVRIPDISFVSWDRLPHRRIPRQPIANLVPDLAVEILSKSNTKKEMGRKLRDYFKAGVRLVWYIDPEARTVQVYAGLFKSKRLTASQTLEGAPVLPGFSLSLRQFFERAERRQRR